MATISTSGKLRMRNLISGLIVGTITFVSASLVETLSNGSFPTLKQLGVAIAIGVLTTIGKLAMDWNKDDVLEAKKILSSELPDSPIIAFENLNITEVKNDS